MLIRAATEDDLPAVKEIYDGHVRDTVATFDVEPRPLDHWRGRLTGAGPGDHLLVAVEDGVVLGYGSSSPYRPRAAYRHTRETSVYVADRAQGRGVGRALYDGLLTRLREDGIRTAVAVVALPNPGSRGLHLRHGFTSVGVLREVGHKLGRWIDTELFQLMLD